MCIIISLVPRTIEAHYVYAVIVCGVEMMEGRKGERQGGRKQKKKGREGGRKKGYRLRQAQHSALSIFDFQ